MGGGTPWHPTARRHGPAPHRARGQQPADDGPPGQDVRTQHFIGRVDDPTDVANEVTAQRLAVWGRQVLALEPILVPLLLTKAHLGEGTAGTELWRGASASGHRSKERPLNSRPEWTSAPSHAPSLRPPPSGRRPDLLQTCCSHGLVGGALVLATDGWHIYAQCPCGHFRPQSCLAMNPAVTSSTR